MENCRIKNKTVLVGGGGHALSLLEAKLSDPPAGYIDLCRSERLPLEWFGDDSAAPRLAEEGALFHISFIYSGFPAMNQRRALIERYISLGVRFAKIVAPTAIVTPNSRIGEGAAILNGAIVNRAVIGCHSVVNSGAIVEHDCIIGDNTFIGPGAILGGSVKIGDNCFIGLGAKIRNGLTIASGVTVGMGAIVTCNLDTPGVYHGNPLRFHNFKQP